MSANTRTGYVIGVYPFEALRTSLAEATKAIRDADRSKVDDDAFAKLCDREDEVVAHLAAHYPASADEAIFLLHILRDRMVENFNPDVISAANRDIVRGMIAYLSGPTPVIAIDTTTTDDAELQSLWQRQQQLYKSMPLAGDMETHDKWASLVREVNQKLADTPARSMMGVAIKLQYASELAAEITDETDEQTLLSARNDAARLAGLEGADVTTRQGSRADRE